MNIPKFRELRAMTQQELADEMSRVGFGWNRVTVAEVEGKRKRPVRLDEFFALAVVLRVPFVALVSPPPGGGRIKVAAGMEFTDVGFSGLAFAGWDSPRPDQLALRRERLQERLEQGAEDIAITEADMQSVRTELAEIEAQLAEEEQSSEGAK